MTGRQTGHIDRKHFDADELHWYALDVIRQKEYLVGHMFQRRGCMTFIPTEMGFRKKNRYTKGKMEVARPALPGTIFVGFPTAPNWFKVMTMNLVNGVLSLDDKPRRIDTASREWTLYRSKQLDGAMTIERHKVMVKVDREEVEIERSVALIRVQGRDVIRTHANLKAAASHNRPIVITAAGERARVLGAILGASQSLITQPLLAAA
jgi:acetolactate synthase regulatory subunit